MIGQRRISGASLKSGACAARAPNAEHADEPPPVKSSVHAELTPKLDISADPDMVTGPEKMPAPLTPNGEQATRAVPVNVWSPAPEVANG